MSFKACRMDYLEIQKIALLNTSSYLDNSLGPTVGRLYWEMSRHYNSRETEFSAAVAAAAFAIYSVEEGEGEYYRKIRRKDYEKAKTNIRTRKDVATNPIKLDRLLTGKEVKDAGESSSKKPMEQDRRIQESALPSRKPSRSSSMRPMNSASRNGVETKADSWEKAQLRKINKRYETLKSKILDWENAKKVEAKLRMERKKNELEMRKSRNSQHYQNKVERINIISSAARGQIEEKRRNEEAEVKEKAKHVRLKGKRPVKCFCC